ncbi:MAG: hypothetical protein DME19_01520 [Verrucomicrobia bacterium]|nr:MAG: hypothetical protein DME19_01520 [Verrucomicrobiota bacterium]
MIEARAEIKRRDQREHDGHHSGKAQAQVNSEIHSRGLIATKQTTPCRCRASPASGCWVLRLQIHLGFRFPLF